MAERGGIHAAAVARSPRLQRVLRVLSDGGWHSTLQIQTLASTVATATCISELRAGGHAVECRRRARRDGSPLWEYRMPAPPTPLELEALRRG